MCVAEPGCAHSGTTGCDCPAVDCEDEDVCAAIELAKVANPTVIATNASFRNSGARTALMHSIAENFSRRERQRGRVEVLAFPCLKSETWGTQFLA